MFCEIATVVAKIKTFTEHLTEGFCDIDALCFTLSWKLHFAIATDLSRAYIYVMVFFHLGQLFTVKYFHMTYTC